MTVLSEYQRLEASALWRETPDSQRREVIVSLGDATLMISGLNDTALSHWSLPAIRQLNPGRKPALFAPGHDAEEQLEISDPEMIEALERVLGAIERARPHPGRLRHWLIGGLAVSLVALAVFWLPGAVVRQTATALPQAKRAEIGEEILTEMADLAGRPCASAQGAQALSRLSAALFDDNPPRIVVLPGTLSGSSHLPGNILVINRALAEDHEDPEALAGFLLQEDLRRSQQDPITALLNEAGLMASFRLLTTGEIHTSHLRARAATLLTTQPETPSDEALLAHFETAGVSSEAFAYAIDPTGETTLTLIEADPMRGRLRTPLINDADWIRLQEICN